VCVVPRGMAEDHPVVLREPAFEVLANAPVSFQLYTSTTSTEDETQGTLREAVRDELTALPPIRTVLRHGKKLAARTIPVHVEARRTALGTLELWCASTEGQHRWRLEFQLRDAPLLGDDVAEQADAELAIDAAQLAAAQAAVRAVYPASGPPSAA